MKVELGLTIAFILVMLALIYWVLKIIGVL